ncbi:MAG: SCO family protein [Nitrospirota bacterium]
MIRSDSRNKRAAKRRLGVIVTAAALAFVAGSAAGSGPAFPRGLIQDPPRLLPDVTLTNQNGSAVRLSELRGKWLWIFVGYTFCPDVCPTALADVAREYDALGPAKSGVRAVFLSVDPARDSADRLKEYVRHFHPDFIALTGQVEEIDRLVRALGARYNRKNAESAGGYLVDHTTYVHVVDPEGRLRARYSASAEPGGLSGDFTFLKGEKP